MGGMERIAKNLELRTCKSSARAKRSSGEAPGATVDMMATIVQDGQTLSGRYRFPVSGGSPQGTVKGAGISLLLTSGSDCFWSINATIVGDRMTGSQSDAPCRLDGATSAAELPAARVITLC